MHPALTHAPALLSTYLRRGEAGFDAMAERLHDRAHERPGERFGKGEAAYLPQTPVPPLGWPVRCERCRFYREGAPGAPARCHLVGREGDRWGGEAIHPRGVCALWMPPADEPAFAWLRDRLDPRGATSERGRYRPRDAPADGAADDGAIEEAVPASGGEDGG